jgi:hypothetical protein
VAEQTASERRWWTFGVTRDSAMFLLGAGAFIYELLSGDNRSAVLYSSLALMGVTAALRGFTVVRKNGNGAG